MQLRLTPPPTFLSKLVSAARAASQHRQQSCSPATPDDIFNVARCGMDPSTCKTLCGKDKIYIDTGCFSGFATELRVEWRMLHKEMQKVASLPPLEAGLQAKLLESGLSVHELLGKKADTRYRKDWCYFYALCGRAFGPLVIYEFQHH